MREQILKKSGFSIHNRKYLGKKNNIIKPIMDNIVDKVGRVYSFADIFAGTGVVANAVHQLFPDASLIVNDILYSNYVIYQAFFGFYKQEVSVKKIKKIIQECNGKPGYYGYVTYNFGGTYFTFENSKKIDEIRDYIESLYDRKVINFKEKCVIITSLVYAIDKVANTCGQYDSFLKHLGSKSMENGVHKVDSNVYKLLDMQMPDISVFNKDNLVISMDANVLVEHINPQVMYIDPPYNTRQYVDNYHLLENIAKWEKPEVFGKTKKFERKSLKSSYSQKRYVRIVFDNLIKNINADHVFLSYNSEGILDKEYIIETLSKRGKVQVKEIPYNVFGNGAGKSKKRKLIEYLFYIKL